MAESRALAMARWELAALAGRLRTLEARHPVADGEDEPPAYVHIAVGLPADRLRDLTRVLAQRLVVQPGHRPVVVTDCAEFPGARAAGVILEYLPDPATWRRHRPDMPWEDLLTERLTRLFTDHGCARITVIDPDDPPGLADLLA